MRPRFLGELGPADLVTVANAALGFVAAIVAVEDPTLGARLILLAAIADGLDGVLARRFGATPVGEHLDSLADVASFGVAPAVLVYAVAAAAWTSALVSPRGLLVVVVPAVFVVMAVVRLGFYMLRDRDGPETVGVQTTLAATLLAVGFLAGVTQPAVLVAATAVLVYLMVAPITYPKLYARDALVLGLLQFLVVLAPTAFNRALPRVLLVCALAYLLLAPVAYWRES